MYTRCTECSVKEAILKSFCNVDGNLRVVIGTIAFGMGIDCPNVRHIIHWGPSADIESYVQETGRSGRDEFLSRAVLFHTSADYRFSSQAMVDYCKNPPSVFGKCFLKTLMNKLLHLHAHFVHVMMFVKLSVLVCYAVKISTP